MRKLIILLLTILSFHCTAFAAGLDNNANSELDNITEAIVTEANELYADELTRKITINDVDYSKSYKVYVDTNIFRIQTNSYDEIKNALASGTYIYLVPITIGDDAIMVNVQKGLPLSKDKEHLFTEAEKQEVRSKEGKWFASVFTLYSADDKQCNYAATLENITGEIPEGTLLVGGLPFFQDMVAVIPNSAGEVESVVPFNNALYNEASIRDMETAPGVYDYNKLKSYINNLNSTNLDISVSGTPKYMALSACVILAALTAFKLHG